MINQRSGSFLCKKWSLFSVALLGIIGALIIASIAPDLVNEIAKSFPNSYKNNLKRIIMIGAVIGILFNSLGLFGSYKEHFGMTLTYAIFMALASLSSISIAVKTSSNWLSVILYLIITGLAFAFAGDLYILRNQMIATPMIVSTVQPQTVVHIDSGYSGHQKQWTEWESPPPAYSSTTNLYKPSAYL